MPKQEGQKSKLVTLLRILEQRTDENHRLNVPQLVQLLENQGILAERKSIYSDIDTLRSLGYDIQLQRGRGGGYWMASRAFELSELKLLVDAVQSSSVISARTSKRIIHKLEALCSDYEGTQLQRQVYVDGRPKTDSQTLLYSIDALHTAINRGCLVQFRYKGSSAVRTVSPWQLAWENGCYYLIAYQDEKAPPVRHYRWTGWPGCWCWTSRAGARSSSAPSICPPICASTSICSAAPSTGSLCGVLPTLSRSCGSALAGSRCSARRTQSTSTLMCPSASASSFSAGCAALAAR